MTADAGFMEVSAIQIDAPTVEGPSDEALIQRLRRGDTSAGEVLVRRYHEPLLRYLRRLAGRGHLAEELLQATWLSVLEHIDKFNPALGGGFRAWVFRIATNKAHDLWRSSGREQSARLGMLRITDQLEARSDQALEQDEQQQRLIRAIDQLPESQRMVLLLRYYSQMKFVDIARTLGCPLNTALGRMHKAMLRLKELMEQ
jgi:RNA polymerase sigma-70 factor (ECF subfamily)